MATGTIKAHNWRKVGDATGNTVIALPTDTNWTEVYVKAFFGGNRTYCIVFNMPRVALAEGDGVAGSRFLGGTYKPNDYHSMIMTIVNNRVWLNAWSYNGTDYLANSLTEVYVR